MFPMKHPALLLPLAALLASCGYSPLYAPVDGTTIASRVQVGTIEMGNLPERNVGQRRTAQVLDQRLRQSFPNTAMEMDTVNIVIREESSALALKRTSIVEREQLDVVATVTLENPSGDKLFKTDVVTTTAYNVETTPYATESGKTYARLTAARNLAEEIARRLNLFYRSNPAPKPLTIEQLKQVEKQSSTQKSDRDSRD